MSNQSEFNALSSGDIRISPYKINILLELKIENRINDHGRLYFKAVVPEEEQIRYVETTSKDTQIEVEGPDGVLFKGLATKVSIKSVRGIYYMEVYGASNTYRMDVKFKNRSFQKLDMTYSDLVKKVIADYGGDFIDTVSEGYPIENFILQYNETDWEFLKRMASHFYTGLVADITSETPRFWFGIPNGKETGDLEDFHYSKCKDLSTIRDFAGNYIYNAYEGDFTYFSAESKRIFTIGDMVGFKGKSLFVKESVVSLCDAVLKNDYIITTKGGLVKNSYVNKQIVGLALEGKVIDISKDEIKIHLNIDNEQKKEEACWFPYSTFYTSEGHTGWYCMPELEDYVNLYFPTGMEQDGIVLNSIRRRTKGGDKIKDPGIKFFRTKFGKELMFSKDEIVITGIDNEEIIRVNEKNGITVMSKRGVRVLSKDDISINASAKISIKAADEIKIACKESSIKMEGVTTINGVSIKTN